MNRDYMDGKNTIVKILLKNEMFGIFSERRLMDIAEFFTLELYSKNQNIELLEGGGSYFILVSGSVILTENEGRLAPFMIKPGTGFYEKHIFEGPRYLFTAFAASNVTVLQLSKIHFYKFLELSPKFKKYYSFLFKNFEKVVLLKSLPFFSDLIPREIVSILKIMKKRRVEQGGYLFKQGGKGCGAWFILSGLLKSYDESQNVLFDKYPPGSVIGGINLAEEQVNLSAVRAAENSVVFFLGKKKLHYIIDDFVPRFKIAILNDSLKTGGPLECSDTPDVEFKEKSVLLPRGFKRRRISSAAVTNPALAGLACVKTIAGEKQRELPERWQSWVQKKIKDNDPGSLNEISDFLESLGFVTRKMRLSLEQLHETPYSSIIMDRDNIPCLISSIDKRKKLVAITHPLEGITYISYENFEKNWCKETLLAFNTPVIKETHGTGVIQKLKTYLPFFSPFKSVFYWILFISAILMLLALVAPLFTQTVIDKVLFFSDKTLLTLMISGIIIVAFFQVIGSTLKDFLVISVIQKVEIVLNSHIFTHLLNLPLQKFTKKESGEYHSSFYETKNLLNTIARSVITLLIDLVTVPFYLLYLFIQNRNLAFTGLIFAALLIILMNSTKKRLKAHDEELFKVKTDNLSFLYEILRSIQTVKNYFKPGNFLKKGIEQLSGRIKSDFDKAALLFKIEFTAKIILFSGTLTVLAYGAFEVLNKNMSVGQFVAFNAIYAILLIPIGKLVGMWDEVQTIDLFFSKLTELLIPDPDRTPAKIDFLDLQGSIKMENVYFRYDGSEKHILSNINLNIKAGWNTSIVGKSGSGKSTLLMLIRGLIKPTRGNVFLDNIDIDYINSLFLPRYIGMVEQNPYLFSGSILENIKIGLDAYSMDPVLAASSLAEADPFIREMPSHYYTVITEGGRELSSGQKQQIAIARALVKDPRLLLMDEGTSALDIETGEKIFSNIFSCMADKTFISIPHRLDFAINSDHIIVLDEGEIIEQGTHRELMENRGLYYYLFTKGGG